MSENDNETPQVPPGVAGEAAPPTITIALVGTKLEVNGPLHDAIFCYGMLERAKDVVRAVQQRSEKNPGGVTPSGLHIPNAGFRPPRSS